MKKRILRIVRTTAVRVAALALMLALTAAAVLYLHGYFDFTFIERVPVQSADTPDTDTDRTAETEAAERAPDTEAVTEPSEGTDSGSVDDLHQSGTDASQNNSQNSEQKQEKQTAKTVSASLVKTKTALTQRYSYFTTGIYQQGKTILTNTGITGLGTKYSYSTYEARTTVTTEYERGCIVTEETTVTQDRPAVILRNGYIIRDMNGKLSLLQADGTTVLSDYDESVFRLTELRDRDGNALFASVAYEKREVYPPIMVENEFTGRLEESGYYEEEPVAETVEVLTYYTRSDDGKWVKSDYTDDYPHAESDVGLSFDAPLDYGASDSDIVRYYNYGQWGYKNAKTGDVVVYPRFTRAYNFHDGYAVAFDHYAMYFLNEKGTVLYSVRYDKPEVFATYNEITLPDTNGIEALGTYYFSHGLTRVRFRENLVTYQTYYYIKSDDRSVLYDVNGKEFPIPSGYTLTAYSDGVLLLQNNETGLYGCMNYKGAWIVQPEYSYAVPFLSGLAVIGDENGKKGLVDTDGNWVLPQVYDAISAPSAGMIAVYDATIGWEVYRMMTK